MLLVGSVGAAVGFGLLLHPFSEMRLIQVVQGSALLTLVDPATVRATVDAIRRGEQFEISDPESSEQDLLAANPGLDSGEIAAQLDALDGAFVGDDDKPGVFDPKDLIAWAGWEQRFGIVKTKPDVRRMFDLDAG